MASAMRPRRGEDTFGRREWECGKCGAALEFEWGWCPYCGTEVSWDQAAMDSLAGLGDDLRDAAADGAMGGD